MNKHWLFKATVIVLLVMVGWWVLDEDPQPAPPSPQAQEQRPDYFMEDFSLLATDHQGRPTWELKAPRMVHFVDDDTWELEQPDVLYHMENGQPWQMTADRGRAWDGLNEAMLDGDVQFSREAGEHNPEARLDTADVRLRPNVRQAQTDQPAQFRSASSYIDGIGFLGDFAKDTLELQSEVKARYVPPTP